ncbi:guanylate cyclase 32E-like, partial [Stegodyphus dumicola]|uniref:guanylate cyclase 32E-like n=1 Tax=Stegodyphus dumicola TaxID=202533 RepID=UPI0015B24B45
MSSMATALLVTSFLFTLSSTELQPHRTVVDLHRLKSSAREHPLDPNKPNITIGFLCSFKYLGNLIAGAIPLAVEMVNENPLLLPDHNLRFMYLDSGEPNTAVTIRKMTQMKDDGVTAFIGPDHSCVSEALVAAAWDIPMITY